MVKQPHMIVESKISVILLQPSQRLKLNFLKTMLNRIPHFVQKLVHFVHTKRPSDMNWRKWYV